jgi:hypothetical protein
LSFDFDKYQSGGNFISAAEKKVLAENGIPFVITAIRQVHKFDNENYELSIVVPNPETGDDEERTLSFPIGSGAESRDAMLHGMKEYLAGEGEEVKAKLTKVGRAYFLVSA